MRTYIHYITLLVLLPACAPKSVGAIDESGADTTMATAASEATDALTTTDEPPATTTVGPDETTGIVGETGDTSGGSAESGSSESGDTGEVVQHASCQAPLPDPLPALPHVKFAGDTPTFALWQALACDDPAVAGAPTCGQDSDCASDNCVDFTGSAGVCSYADIDIWCDGEGEVMGSADGACWICLEPFEHARACCDDPNAGFDCRAWPFTDEPGAIGKVCAVHEDCELGLVCSEPKWYSTINHNGQSCGEDADCDEGVCDELFGQCGTEEPKFAGYGICACPGTDSMTIVPGDACFQ